MKMYFVSFFMMAALCAFAFAHDEGHGPKVTDAPQNAGIKIAPVIDAKEAKKGAKASMIYKAEITPRAEDGTIRVFFYEKEPTADGKLKPLDLSKFDKSAKGAVEFKKNKKWVKTPFTLTKEEGVFVGKAPKSPSKPFNIDVVVKEGGKELLTAFDNLD